MVLTIMDPGFAERYESTLVPVIFRPWAQEMLRRAGMTGGERVLDLACGTGVVTRQVAKDALPPASLTGADYSEGMLAIARDMAAREGVEATWVQAVAGDLPFGDASFDVAFCQQALQFFPDKPRAVAELYRVLSPGGRAVVCVQTGIDENPHLKAQAEAMEACIGAEAGAAVRAICGYPDPGPLKALFETAGFSDVTLERVALTLSHPDGRAFARGAMGGMHTGDRMTGLETDAQSRAVDAFLSRLGSGYDGQAITFPHVSNVVTAIR